MTLTSFWHPDGTPISAQQFMQLLFGRLPEFFKDETELRALWSAPATRKKLLEGRAEKGFGHDQMSEMQKIINAENSDLFDVLAYIAYALPRSLARTAPLAPKSSSTASSTLASSLSSISFSPNTSKSASKNLIRKNSLPC